MCEEAFEAGVAKAVDYLESHAIWVRRGRGYEPAGGMHAASYRRDTNPGNSNRKSMSMS